jgi:hypothetical protein
LPFDYFKVATPDLKRERFRRPSFLLKSADGPDRPPPLRTRIWVSAGERRTSFCQEAKTEILHCISPSTSQYRHYHHYRQRPRNTFIIDVRQGGVTLRSLAPCGVARECVSTRTPYVCTSCQASEGLGWHLGPSIPHLGVTIYMLTSVMMVLAVTAIDTFV